MDIAFEPGVGGWPWPTLLVNLVGAFVLGAVLGAALGRVDRRRVPAWLRGQGFTTGVLGSFTTFSALAVEASGFTPVVAVVYGAATLVGGLLSAALGWRAGRGRP